MAAEENTSEGRLLKRVGNYTSDCPNNPATAHRKPAINTAGDALRHTRAICKKALAHACGPTLRVSANFALYKL